MFSSTTNSAAAAALSSPPQQLPPSSDQQLCYVHCNICDTVLAVSVPSSSLFKAVTVRCGHCTNLLPVTMRGLLLPATSPNQLQMGRHSFNISPPSNSYHNLLEEIGNAAANPVMNQANLMNDFPVSAGTRGLINYEHPKPLLTNRPPEKRQRVPSAYNRFIKDEIQRIKAGNPDISHREAFSTAAKNWAHFPHIHFGLMSSNQTVMKNTGTTTMRQQGSAEDNLAKDSFYVPAPNIGFSPY